MRKQYYFRPSSDGYFAWDVDRLVELTKDFEVNEISLESIKELDESYWFSDLEDATCRAVIEHVKLIQDTDLIYPIISAKDGRVMDGMHRVGKAVLQGRETIEGVQFEEDPEPNFMNVYPDELPY